jgi:hypothetical protein
MLKTIGKVLAILLVAGLLAAGIYALVQNSSLASAGGFPGREFGENRVRPENLNQGASPNTPGSPTDGSFASRPERGFRGEHEHGEFSLGRGLAGMFGQIIKIAVITGIILLAQKLLSRRAPVKAASQA